MKHNMESNKFLLACFRDNVGSNVGFHCINGKGYSTNIDLAHVYTKDEAQKAWDTAREYDQPISLKHILESTVWKVDYQYIPQTSQISDDYMHYVAYEKGIDSSQYDGNDVYWLDARSGAVSTDFYKASKIKLEDVQKYTEHFVLIPFETAFKQKRRTFQYSKFLLEKMVIDEGLVLPMHLQVKKKSGTGKTKWNCPKCGRIVWQYNPYDFEGCKYENCGKGIN